MYQMKRSPSGHLTLEKCKQTAIT